MLPSSTAFLLGYLDKQAQDSPASDHVRQIMSALPGISLEQASALSQGLLSGELDEEAAIEMVRGFYADALPQTYPHLSPEGIANISTQLARTGRVSEGALLDVGNMLPEIAAGVNKLQNSWRMEDSAKPQAIVKYIDKMNEDPEADPDLVSGTILRDPDYLSGPLRPSEDYYKQKAEKKRAPSFGKELSHGLTSYDMLPTLVEERYPLVGIGKNIYDEAAGTVQGTEDAEGNIRSPKWDETAHYHTAKNVAHAPTLRHQAAAIRQGASDVKSSLLSQPNKTVTTAKPKAPLVRRAVSKVSPRMGSAMKRVENITSSSKALKGLGALNLGMFAKGWIDPSESSKGMAQLAVDGGSAATTAPAIAFSALDPEQAGANIHVGRETSKQIADIHTKQDNRSYGLLQQQRAQGLINEDQFQKGVQSLQENKSNPLMDMWKSLKSNDTPARKGARAHSPQGTRGRRK